MWDGAEKKGKTQKQFPALREAHLDISFLISDTELTVSLLSQLSLNNRAAATESINWIFILVCF